MFFSLANMFLVLQLIIHPFESPFTVLHILRIPSLAFFERVTRGNHQAGFEDMSNTAHLLPPEPTRTRTLVQVLFGYICYE
jgi:hypothetical protein